MRKNGRLVRSEHPLLRQWWVVLLPTFVLGAAAGWLASLAGDVGAGEGDDIQVIARMAVGSGVGLLVGLVVAFVRHRRDETVRSFDGIGRRVGVPVLAAVPVAERPLKRTPPVVDVAEPRLLEAFRSLRTTVRFLASDEPIRAIAVTSPEQGDGKSTVAANLAAAFAATGASTVLVSGDLRRPMADAAFGVAGHLGVSDLLQGATSSTAVPSGSPRITADDFTRATAIPHLSILPSGSATSDPGALFAVTRLTELVEDLVKAFDVVVVDCPPTVLSETVELARASDAVLVVCALGRTTIAALETSCRQLDHAGAHVVGLVANLVPQKQAGASSYFVAPSER